jgi:hypothetical protein
MAISFLRLALALALFLPLVLVLLYIRTLQYLWGIAITACTNLRVGLIYAHSPRRELLESPSESTL